MCYPDAINKPRRRTTGNEKAEILQQGVANWAPAQQKLGTSRQEWRTGSQLARWR